MGLGQSKYVSEPDLDSSDEELEPEPCIKKKLSSAGELQPESNMENKPIVDNIDNMLKQDVNVVDATIPQNSIYDIHNYITLDDVRQIEADQLDVPEVVALIYLLYDKKTEALKDLQHCISTNSNHNYLYKWAKNDPPNWQKKIIEALCIIQNYKALKCFPGYNKIYLQRTYMPLRPETTCVVNRLRKALYLIAEKLGTSQTLTLLSYLNFPCSLAFSSDYLEYFFMFLECKGSNFNELQKGLKHMNLEVLSSYLEGILPIESTNIVENRNFVSPTTSATGPFHERRPTTARDNTYLISQGTTFEDNLNSFQLTTTGISLERQIWTDTSKYDINPNDPGIVLIINQETFYTETDPNYKELLHEHNDVYQLDERKGTQKDKQRLKDCFGRMNFTIIDKDNLTHLNMIKIIEEVIDASSDKSSLIICILTHGDNGVVYGVNSCKVPVRDIENLMCKRNEKLKGKPKVLILQSCQGKQCQKVIEEETDGYTTDGPSKGPVTADLLTFWATIPGFAAIRSLTKGSWFIQALCDEIESGNPQYHFLEICTKVMSKVTRQEWKEGAGINVMVPQMVTTLTKMFHLPPFKR